MSPYWRPMVEADLPGVVAVARAAFPDHYEDLPCFTERLALYPAFCEVLAGEGDGVLGYLIAYPWPLGAIPPLNSLLGELPGQTEAIYLHDLALSPNARGGGYAKDAVEMLMTKARNLAAEVIALVSVNATLPFWRGQGFEAEDSPPLQAKLASYGPGSHYMIRRL